MSSPRAFHAADGIPPLRQLAAQAYSRAAGAPLVEGNHVRVLRDAAQNFPAWLDAIRGANRLVCFENYIFTDDDLTRVFAEVLSERAQAGVKVRLLYDWFGTSSWDMRHLWRRLRSAGVEVRCFNPPRWEDPFAWFSRDHRKTLSVDGRLGYVSGLCVSARWEGNPEKKIEPWRDTGIEIAGPAVLQLESAFARVWEVSGGSFPQEERTRPESVPPHGSVALRVVAGAPSTAGLYRLDQLIAALARETLWLTDAYFVGVSSYVQALCAAARDGVDVRLLVPGASDQWWISPLSRAGYRPLLEAGVRVFEWNGSMLHAKTAVADGRWARVGSTNLNLSSWLANWELDVAIEDAAVASAFSYAFEQDLAHSTEIVLAGRRRARPLARTHTHRHPRARHPGASGRGRRVARRQRPRRGHHEPAGPRARRSDALAHRRCRAGDGGGGRVCLAASSRLAAGVRGRLARSVDRLSRGDALAGGSSSETHPGRDEQAIGARGALRALRRARDIGSRGRGRAAGLSRELFRTRDGRSFLSRASGPSRGLTPSRARLIVRLSCAPVGCSSSPSVLPPVSA